MGLRKALKRIGGEIIYRIRPERKSSVDAVRHHPVFERLGPGDLAIDCGANLGLVSEVLAKNGAEVHAFEPNPDAFAHLVKRCAYLPNVHAYQQAVLDEPGKLTLYLHLNYDRNPERFSKGSSLISEKGNVSESRGVEVDVIDLAAFIERLDRQVNVLKMDVEGAEYRILNRLITSGVIDRIDQLLVETHAGSIPSLRKADSELRALIAQRGLQQKIDLNWI